MEKGECPCLSAPSHPINTHTHTHISPLRASLSMLISWEMINREAGWCYFMSSGAFFERSFIVSVKLWIPLGRHCYRERRAATEPKRLIMKKLTSEECVCKLPSSQHTHRHTHTRNQFIHSWQRLSFISLIWTILLFFTASSLIIIQKCSHKCWKGS